VTGVNPRLATWGAATIGLGILIPFLVDAPALRLVGSVTAIAIGFSLLRQAFRLE
jgi:hypothetical protein